MKRLRLESSKLCLPDRMYARMYVEPASSQQASSVTPGVDCRQVNGTPGRENHRIGYVWACRRAGESTVDGRKLVLTRRRNSTSGEIVHQQQTYALPPRPGRVMSESHQGRRKIISKSDVVDGQSQSQRCVPLPVVVLWLWRWEHPGKPWASTSPSLSLSVNPRSAQPIGAGLV